MTMKDRFHTELSGLLTCAAECAGDSSSDGGAFSESRFGGFGVRSDHRNHSAGFNSIFATSKQRAWRLTATRTFGLRPATSKPRVAADMYGATEADSFIF